MLWVCVRLCGHVGLGITGDGSASAPMLHEATTPVPNVLPRRTYQGKLHSRSQSEGINLSSSEGRGSFPVGQSQPIDAKLMSTFFRADGEMERQTGEQVHFGFTHARLENC